MTKLIRLVFSDRDHEDAHRQTMSLAGLAVTLLVLVISMWLTKQLQAKSAIEDCLLAGRTNCDILLPEIR